jgi:phospholipid/cholesterol/gamma-HCH transport system permease protein
MRLVEPCPVTALTRHRLAAWLPLQQVAFLGHVLLAALASLRGRGMARAADISRVLADSSARALPIVVVVNLMVGAILAFVGAVQLVQFGAGIFVADLVSIAVAREMAAVITAVVMAGRTGAAFAAELATMQANEEIDALEVLGIDPVAFLVLPRVVALVIMMPLLYVFACTTGLAGGLLVASGMLDIALAAYVDRSFEALSWAHIGLGAAKSLVFGALIAMIGCYCGLHAQRHAAGVGRATTQSVVLSIVGVIALDAVFAVAANALDV